MDKQQRISTSNEQLSIENETINLSTSKTASQVNNLSEESSLKNENNNIDKQQKILTSNEQLKIKNKTINLKQQKKSKQGILLPQQQSKVKNTSSEETYLLKPRSFVTKTSPLDNVNQPIQKLKETLNYSKQISKIMPQQSLSSVSSSRKIGQVQPQKTPKQRQEFKNSHYPKPKTEEETKISINIGRIIVRPAEETPKKSKSSQEKRKQKKPNLSLKDYLKQRRT